MERTIRRRAVKKSVIDCVDLPRSLRKRKEEMEFEKTKRASMQSQTTMPSTPSETAKPQQHVLRRNLERQALSLIN